jgi:peroxiredoxin
MKKINVLLAAIVLFSMINLPGNSQVSVGEEAPDFSFTSTSGETFTLSDHRGKVVFMFLFGNNCPSCRKAGELTESDIYDVFKDDPDFVAVGLDQWDNTSNLASVSTFKSRTGISYPLLIKAGSISTSYVTTYDRLLVIDKEGILRHKGTTLAINDIENAVSVIRENLMTSGIEKEISTFSMKFFPNPVTDYAELKISLSQRADTELLIYNSLGQLKYKNNLEVFTGENIINVDLRMLEDGIHFYRLRLSDDELKTGKFIVKSR